MYFGNTGNPMIDNLIALAKKGEYKQVENFARNFCKEQGVDYDKAFPAFLNTIKR